MRFSAVPDSLLIKQAFAHPGIQRGSQGGTSRPTLDTRVCRL